MPNRTDKQATLWPDYQERGLSFQVGDIVFPRLGTTYESGRVVQVYPAIGMIDVEYPHGVQRTPVEQVYKTDGGDVIPPPVGANSVPGGANTVISRTAKTVADVWVKQALYWAARDRQYRATRAEQAEGRFFCPRCDDQVLKKAVYKRRGGSSERLLGCPNCMFLVKECDIVTGQDCEGEE